MSEFAIRTVVSTPSAPIPSFVTKSRPKNASPVTEIATVRPAKMTAAGGRAASAAASRRACPRAGAVLNRVTMKSEVVDADANPDHRHEDGRDRVDGRQPGEDEEQHERRSDGDEREGDRNRRRDERAEDDQEDDERGEEAQKLLRALLDRRELGIAVELGDDIARRDRVPDRVLDGHDLRPVSSSR